MFERISCFAPVLFLVFFACPRSFAEEGDVDADVNKANSYDNDWEHDWVMHLREIHDRAEDKTVGFVLHFGDMASYISHYSSFARNYSGNNPLRRTIIWSCGPGDTDFKGGGPTGKNGWNLARRDLPGVNRAWTAAPMITTDQWLHGGYKDFVSGPHDPAPIDTLLNNRDFRPGREGIPVAVVQDAQVCILMLGTYDIIAGMTPEVTIANLETMADKIEARDIMVVLSTIQPNLEKNAQVNLLNKGIRLLARRKKLPLIDLNAEIIRRRPKDSWLSTLVDMEGVALTSGEYRDPFDEPGALSNSGYLLRGFLSVCKLDEIKRFVIDRADEPPAPPGNASAAPRVKTSQLPAGRAGNVYGFLLEADGGQPPYSWQGFKIPLGMKLLKNGILAGIPKKRGEYTIKVKVMDRAGKPDRKILQLEIK